MATIKKGRRRFMYGSIFQRKVGGSWTIDYHNSGGRRVQQVAKGAICWQEAHEALKNAVRKEFLKSQGIKIESEPVRFDELADLYIENYAKINKKSWKDDMYRINAHMRPFFNDCELREITPLLIEKYRTKRLRSVTRSTVNRETTIMKKMLNLAVDWRLTDENPVSKVKMFSEQGTEKERILTDEEETRLLSECPSYLKPIILTALLTGMRRGEILNLRWSRNVDLGGKTIKADQTKNGKSRIIPINDQLYRELLKVKSMNGGSEYVFPNPETGRPYAEVKKSFKGACARAGVHGLRFHDLRHTFATRLIESGVDIITVRDLLGHFSVRITQRYTHSNHEQKREAVELLLERRRNGPEKADDLVTKW